MKAKLYKPRSTSALPYHLTSLSLKEKYLQDSQLQINKYQEDLQHQRKSLDLLTKENKSLSTMVSSLLSESHFAINKPDLIVKINQAYLLIEAKKEISRLKGDLQLKTAIIEEYKRNLKLTKRNEFLIENEILLKEIHRLKMFCDQLKDDIEKKDILVFDIMKLKNDFVKQNYVILALNEKVGVYLKEIKERDEVIERMNRKMEDKEVWYKDMKIKLDYMRKVNEVLKWKAKEEKDFVPVVDKKMKVNGNSKLKTNGKIKGNGHKHAKDFVLIKRQFKIYNKRNNNTAFDTNSNNDTNNNKMLQTEGNINHNHNYYNRDYSLTQCNSQTNFRIKSKSKSKEKYNISSLPYHDDNNIKNEYKEITYILMKSIEGKHLSKDSFINLLKTPLPQIITAIQSCNHPLLISLITTNICNTLLIKDTKESMAIQNFLHTFITKPTTIDHLTNGFLSLYNTIANKQSNITQLRSFLISNCTLLFEQCALFDKENNGEITFDELKKIINDNRIKIQGELLEEMIYQMKKGEVSGLYKLNYRHLKGILEEESQEHQEQDQEYEKNCNVIIRKVVDGLRTNKACISNLLFSLTTTTDDDDSNNTNDITIEAVINLLQSKLGISFTDIERLMFCTKYTNKSHDCNSSNTNTLIMNIQLFYNEVNNEMIIQNEFLKGILQHMKNKGLSWTNFLSLMPSEKIITINNNDFIDINSIEVLMSKCQIIITNENTLHCPLLFTQCFNTHMINLDYLTFLFTSSINKELQSYAKPSLDAIETEDILKESESIANENSDSYNELHKAIYEES